MADRGAMSRGSDVVHSLKLIPKADGFAYEWYWGERPFMTGWIAGDADTVAVEVVRRFGKGMHSRWWWCPLHQCAK